VQAVEADDVVDSRRGVGGAHSFPTEGAGDALDLILADCGG
jgi:hypothetical protein